MKEIQPAGKLLTCILPKGKTAPVVKVLAEKGINRVNFAFARGFDLHDVAKKNGVPGEEEKEILQVIAKDQQEGEELFDLIYSTGQLHQLGGGFLYMTPVQMASAYFLPQDLASPQAAQKEAVGEESVESTRENVIGA